MELTHEKLSQFLLTMKRIRLFEERVARKAQKISEIYDPKNIPPVQKQK